MIFATFFLLLLFSFFCLSSFFLSCFLLTNAATYIFFFVSRPFFFALMLIFIFQLMRTYSFGTKQIILRFFFLHTTCNSELNLITMILSLTVRSYFFFQLSHSIYFYTYFNTIFFILFIFYQIFVHSGVFFLYLFSPHALCKIRILIFLFNRLNLVYYQVML